MSYWLQVLQFTYLIQAVEFQIQIQIQIYTSNITFLMILINLGFNVDVSQGFV